jgi:predicted RNA-binding protein YlxR (DUF448 family)
VLARPHHSDQEIDAGPRKGGAVTERMCAATRLVKPIDEMIRFVVAPDGAVVPDVKQNLPGRGIWVTATGDALRQAIKRKAFGAGFKRDVQVDAGLVALTDRLLESAVLDALAMCGKASLVVSGFAKVEAALSRGRIVTLLHAADAAPDGVRKLDAAMQRSREGTSPARIVDDLSSEQLDLALARPNVVHAALLPGSASNTFLARHARLMRFRAGASPGEDDRRGSARRVRGLGTE